MVEVKGSAVVTLPEFVEKKYPHLYESWLNSLSPDSQKILRNKAIVSSWLPLEHALSEPLRKLCDLASKGKMDAAWESGIFSAEKALTGIYKVFVKFGSPQFIISRAGSIIQMYYKGIEISIAETTPKSVTLHITKFEKPDSYVEYRIGGWMTKALEISGCKNVKTLITKDIAKGDKVTEYVMSWT